MRKLKEREYLKGCKEVENSVALQIIEESLKEGVPVKLIVMGNSMFPTLVGGKDVVTLLPFTREHSLTIGDVVLFRYKKAFLLHRVIEIPLREEEQPTRLEGEQAVPLEEDHSAPLDGDKVVPIERGQFVLLRGDAATTIEKIQISDILAIAHYRQRSPALLFWRRVFFFVRGTLARVVDLAAVCGRNGK
jgi:hypothetical protein